ncbi:anti-anti-sigma factor [Crossiella equi]|uniref:Anti-sigma factor antagonist n=1 Tax=Crossiella equi TaxID=130796 RepID=A0ABS5ARW6_9PSEU|nr:STAS domain-containing protein [Crossiella equi]MBP2479308.1 anti-anti-sigma factor [Crossiella equi]
MSSATAPMTITVLDRDRVVVLAVAGEVDMLTTPALLDAVNGALATDPPVLVLDLSEVDFFGSSGLAALAEAHERAKGRTELRVVTDNPAVRRPLQVTSLDRLLGVFPNMAAAMEQEAGLG